MIFTLSTTLFSGLLGAIYGFTMLAQHHRMLFKKTSNIILFISPIFRLSILFIIFYNLLHSTFLNSILTLSIFLIAWWTVILLMKDRINE